MQKRVGIRAFALVLMMLFIAGSALAENGAIRTYLTFRITKSGIAQPHFNFHLQPPLSVHTACL